MSSKKDPKALERTRNALKDLCGEDESEVFAVKECTEKLQAIRTEISNLALENIHDEDNWEYEQARKDIANWRRRVLRKFEALLSAGKNQPPKTETKQP